MTNDPRGFVAARGWRRRPSRGLYGFSSMRPPRGRAYNQWDGPAGVPTRRRLIFSV